MAETEDNHEPEYEPEVILIGENMYLEVLSVVGKSNVHTSYCVFLLCRTRNHRTELTLCSLDYSTTFGIYGFFTYEQPRNQWPSSVDGFYFTSKHFAKFIRQ